MAFQVSMKRDEHQRAHEIRECVPEVADRDVCVEIKWVCSVCVSQKNNQGDNLRRGDGAIRNTV